MNAEFTFIQLKLSIVSPALASWGLHVQVGSHLTCLPYNRKTLFSLWKSDLPQVSTT